ncbi:MAG: 2Fe-2S iron-sulfur cluster-binding protein [Bacillota bacterium]
MDKRVRFFVMRGARGRLSPQEVMGKEGMTVLDALIKARLTTPDLGLEYACRNGMACRLCLASIDGEPRYMCATMLEEGMVVAPVSGARAIRDLVTGRGGPAPGEV